jgi:hypothetical protein
VVSPSNAASNDAIASSLLDIEVELTWVTKAGCGAGRGLRGEVTVGELNWTVEAGGSVVAGGRGACSSSNGSIALPLPLSSLGTGTYTDEAPL